MVILFCALGNPVLYLFWPMIAGICYVSAPVLYNPKPTYRSLLEAIEELWMWGHRRDDALDPDVYTLIQRADKLLDTNTKERIFPHAEVVAKV